MGFTTEFFGFFPILAVPITCQPAFRTGPYANDVVANTNSVTLNNLYYDANGVVRIQITQS